MATLLKVLNNLADIKSAGVLHFASELRPGSATLMPHGKKAASKTPMDAYVDGCRATWISTGHPTKTSKRSSSRPTSPPENASGSRRHSKPSLLSLERPFKSASLKRVALRDGIQAPHLTDHLKATSRRRENLGRLAAS